MKNLIVVLFSETDKNGMYEVLSLISLMLIFLAFVIYIFTRKYKKEEVRAPLEDDHPEDVFRISDKD